MAWMGSSLAARWEPYALFSNNCQHFQSELQAGWGLRRRRVVEALLFDNTGDLEGRRTDSFDWALALESLRKDGMRLKFFPWPGGSQFHVLLPRRRYRDQLDLVYEAVRQNGMAMKYASKRMLLGARHVDVS